MNTSHLPDDLAMWPQEAHEVLGVARGIEPRDLRRAYTNLIRIFKPEHHPDHFRRIREAFEYVQRFAVFYRVIQPPEPEPTPTTENTPSHHSEPPASAPVETFHAPLSTRTPIVTVDDLWRRALQYSDGEAYRALVAELERGTPRAELFARLYWLLATCPALDPERPAIEWLCRGMEVTGLSGVLHELYGMEILDYPAEARSTRAARLLAGDHAPLDLVAFVRKRWRALCRASSWDVIVDDFDRVQEVVRRHDEVLWLSLLVDLVTWIAWGRQDPVASVMTRLARGEIRRLEHLALRNTAYFDQLDWFDAVARSCRTIAESRLPLGDLTSLVRDGWLLPADLARSRLEQLLTKISASPVQWVEYFDRALPQGQAALTQFGNLLEQYEPYPGCDLDVPLTHDRVRELADQMLASDNARSSIFRARVLRFCLDQAIDPAVIRWAYHVGPDESLGIPAWVEALAADMSIQLVCRACRLFRA